MINWINAFISILFPRYCAVCGNRITKDNTHLCAECYIGIPRTNFHSTADNRLEKLLWGRINVEKATAYFYYSKGNAYRQLLYQLKYKGQRELGVTLGKSIALELSGSDFFASVDLIIPVPLHRQRLSERGYNQSEQIAVGIAAVTGIPVDSEILTRNSYTQTQTRKSTAGRMENMDGVFQVSPANSGTYQHVLLIDDIVTTGATIAGCGKALQAAWPNVKISVVTIGFVGY